MHFDRKSIGILILFISFVLSGGAAYWGVFSEKNTILPPILINRENIENSDAQTDSNARDEKVENTTESEKILNYKNSELYWRAFGDLQVAYAGKPYEEEIIIRNSRDLEIVSRFKSKTLKNIEVVSGEKIEGNIEDVFLGVGREKVYVAVSDPTTVSIEGYTQVVFKETDFDGTEERVSGSIRVQNFDFSLSPLETRAGNLSNFSNTACAADWKINVINLIDGTTQEIKPVKSVARFIEQNNINAEKKDQVSAIIREYRWIDNETIEFSVNYDVCGERISDYEIWRFNIITGKYFTLI